VVSTLFTAAHSAFTTTITIATVDDAVRTTIAATTAAVASTMFTAVHATFSTTVPDVAPTTAPSDATTGTGVAVAQLSSRDASNGATTVAAAVTPAVLPSFCTAITSGLPIVTTSVTSTINATAVVAVVTTASTPAAVATIDHLAVTATSHHHVAQWALHAAFGPTLCYDQQAGRKHWRSQFGRRRCSWRRAQYPDFQPKPKPSYNQQRALLGLCFRLWDNGSIVQLERRWTPRWSVDGGANGDPCARVC